MSSPGGVLLFTGFPGFLGARLLPRLLELQPGWRAACLVQSHFLEPARAEVGRLAEAAPHTRGRIEIVEGDITREGLGVEPRAAARLQGELVAGFHLAAAYDLAVSRQVGYAVNVEGTRHVLRFVQTAPGFERLHYVSTAYVSGDATGVFRETDLNVGQGFKNHYEATKFEAEVAVVESGVAATVYRPGIVVGDSRTGETAKFDGPYFALRAMERLPSPGLFLRIGTGRSPINIVPVDYVVEAMARLAVREATGTVTYNLTDPRPLSVQDMARLLAGALGRRFLFVPVPVQLGRLLLSPRWLQSWLGMPVQTLEYFDHPCEYDATLAQRALEPLGVRCPRFPEYVDRLVGFYRERRDGVRRSAMI